MALEEFAVRLAVERLKAEEWAQLCERLQELLDKMHNAMIDGDSIAANELDIEWHTLLIDSARNRALSRTWRASGLSFLIWSPERDVYPLSPDKLAVIQQRHQELLDGLRQRVPEQVARAVRAHILNKLSDLNEWLAQKSAEAGEPQP